MWGLGVVCLCLPVSVLVPVCECLHVSDMCECLKLCFFCFFVSLSLWMCEDSNLMDQLVLTILWLLYGWLIAHRV